MIGASGRIASSRSKTAGSSERRLRRVLVDRRHRRHALADVADAVVGQDRHVLQVGAVEAVAHVGAGDYREDAGQRLRLGGVDVDDAGVGVGAVEHFAPEHAFQRQVGRVNGVSGDLVDAVDAADGLSKNLVRH
jgi:hypothetical protein